MQGYTSHMAIKNQIQKARVGKGLSQPELAQLAGVPLSTLQKAEQHQKADHGVTFALRVAHALESTVENVFFLESRSPTGLKSLEPVEAQ